MRFWTSRARITQTLFSMISTTEYLLLELPESMFASVFGGAFNARYDHLYNSEFHISNMEIAFKHKHEGTQTVTSGIMRLHLRNVKITMDGKHTMRIAGSQI